MSTQFLENPTIEARFFSMYEGIVYDREDPKKVGRVRVEIPGLMDNPATGWAWPIGMPGSGAAQQGSKWVPKLGAEVVVWFKQGDPDAPRYLSSLWGDDTDTGNEIPGNVQKITQDIETGAFTTEELTKSQAPDVHVWETNDFRVYIDERTGKRGLILQHKYTGDFIEYDAETYGWQIKATSALIIDVDGLCSIRAGQLQLNDRLVRTTTEKI
jgi:hypothetical protein